MNRGEESKGTYECCAALYISVILCYTTCVPSATQRNIHVYPYFLFAAIHHLKSSPTFSGGPCSSVGRVTVDLIRRSWVRLPPRSKDFFFASCGSLFPFTRANVQWVIHGLSGTLIYISELILCSTNLCSARQEQRRLDEVGSRNSQQTVLLHFSRKHACLSHQDHVNKTFSRHFFTAPLRLKLGK